MAQQSLYRAYRPQGFDDIVGQKHITRTLRNAVAEDAVAHAYLFTGPRGTGKTTTARILAKALECEKGPTADPDTTCQQCVDIAEGRHPDVYELDAASRTQVENVREEIIGRLAYAPTRGRYKVYIIDEVHMLSNHSFNALLKSIEEPPDHTVFILCTTHPHKVPDTIHSRCQRFDFHRIGVEDIVGRLEHIAHEEGITVAPGALTLVAKHAAGGMRDAITTLEQLASFTGKDIALDDVEGLLGEVDVALLVELADLISLRDIAGCFKYVARLAATGIDMNEFARGLIGYFRDLYITAAVGDPTGIVDTTNEQMSRLVSQAAQFGPDRLSRILDLLGEMGAEMRWSSDPRLSLEVGLTRIARPQGEMTIEALAERVEVLERALASGASLPVAAAVRGEPDQLTPETDAGGEAESREEEAERSELRDETACETALDRAAEEERRSNASGGVLDRAHVKRAWPAVQAEIKRSSSSRAHIFANTEVDVDGDGLSMVIEFPADQKFTLTLADETETRQLLHDALAAVLGSPPPFRYQLGRGPVRPPVMAIESTERVDLDPAETAHTTSPEPPHSEDEGEDIDSILRNQFGAEMVAEHPHEVTEGKDDLS